MNSNVVTLENLDETIDQTVARMRAEDAKYHYHNPGYDEFLVTLQEMRAELAECQKDLASVRAGISEVQAGVDGLISQVAAATSLGGGRSLFGYGCCDCSGHGWGCDVGDCDCAPDCGCREHELTRA